MTLSKALSGPRILTLDVELSPNISHTWGLFQQNIGLNQIVEPARVICFAAKWHGKKGVKFFSEFHDGQEAMVQAAWDLLNECDALVTYNGVGFDVKHLQREFILAGLTPPAPFKNIDLLRVVRSQFKFASNKLDWVVQQLGVGAKVKHEGHELWTLCMAGDSSAWSRMKKYNVQDVMITEALFDRLSSWVKIHPHHGLFNGDPSCCFRCGKNDMETHGKTHTETSSFDLLRCRGCGAWSRSTKRSNGVDVKAEK